MLTKEAWEVVKTPLHVGNFLSWQITANLLKLKLIQLWEDFTLDYAGLMADKLPCDHKKNAARVAAFAAFIHLWQSVHVKRTLDLSPAAE